MIETMTTIVVEGVPGGTMTTGTIVVDVGVGPETTGTTIRGKARPALTETRESTGEEDPCHMMRRTGRRPPNSPTSNL